MAAVDVEDDGWAVICLHPEDVEWLVETLLSRNAYWTNSTVDNGWHLAQQILYVRDWEDRRDDGCLACLGREYRLQQREE